MVKYIKANMDSYLNSIRRDMDDPNDMKYVQSLYLPMPKGSKAECIIYPMRIPSDYGDVVYDIWIFIQNEYYTVELDIKNDYYDDENSEFFNAIGYRTMSGTFIADELDDEIDKLYQCLMSVDQDVIGSLMVKYG